MDCVRWNDAALSACHLSLSVRSNREVILEEFVGAQARRDAALVERAEAGLAAGAGQVFRAVVSEPAREQ